MATKTRPRKARPASSSNGAPRDGEPALADPVAALHTKIRDGGFRFEMDHDIESSSYDSHNVRLRFNLRVTVIIATRHAWLGMAESMCGSFSSALCGPDLVLAVGVADRFHTDRPRHNVHRGGTETDPEELQALCEIRAKLFDFLEQTGSMGWLQMSSGGNGRCRLEVELEDKRLGSAMTIDLGLDSDD